MMEAAGLNGEAMAEYVELEVAFLDALGRGLIKDMEFGASACRTHVTLILFIFCANGYGRVCGSGSRVSGRAGSRLDQRHGVRCVAVDWFVFVFDSEAHDP